MSEKTSYLPGEFCWAEVASTDLGASKRFYSSLLGWEIMDEPMDGGGSYGTVRLRGKRICGMYQLDERQRGQPSRWLPYVDVASVDESLQLATKLGAKIHIPAADVAEHGRFGVLLDPGGAALGLWQPRTHIGADLWSDPGAIGWCELATTDVDVATRFYGGLFGWQAERMKNVDNYTLFKLDGRMVGGAVPIDASRGRASPLWATCVVVKDAEAVLKRAPQIGGKIELPLTAMPDVGRYAQLVDVTGASFQIFQGP